MATPGCEKPSTQEQIYPRPLSSPSLPFEFKKDRPFESKVSRRFSDPLPSKLEEMLFAKLPGPPEIDNKEFIPHMMALKRVKEYFQQFLSVKAAEILTGEESDEHDDELVVEEFVIPFLVLQQSFKEQKREMFSHIYRISLIYTLWKMKITEIIGTIPSQALKEEVDQFENEINQALEHIGNLLNELDDCHNVDELREKYQKYVEDLTPLDQTINKLKEDIELEIDLDLKKGIIPVFFSPGARLCHYLGLELNAFQDDEELDLGTLNYYSTEQWILKSLKNAFRYLEDENKFELNVEVLQKLGFTKQAAATLVDSIPVDQRGHISTIDWVKIYIKNQFKYHNLLARECPDRFPYRQEMTGRWFNLRDSETEETTSKCNITNVSLINLDGKSDGSFKTQKGKSRFPERLSVDQKHVVLFHGTDHLSAVDILNKGLDVEKGESNCDFSNKFGFYLTDNIEDAIDWAFTRPMSKPAVLVYLVEKDWLKDRNFLDLRNNVAKCKEVVSHYMNEAEDRKLRKELRKYDFIEGPISTVPRLLNWRSRTRHPNFKPGSYQLCIKSEEFSQEFDLRINSIMFFDKKK